MTGKRSRLEMYIDVLEKIDSGISRPTNIMYRCNLSWIPMKEILDYLLKKDLIKETEKKDRKIYEITEKGQNILKYLESVLYALENRRRKIIPLLYEDEQRPITARLSLRKSLSPITQTIGPSDNDGSLE